MDEYLIWLILALVLLGCEMMVGSIFLLAFVAGSAAACIAALVGTSFTVQCTTAAVITIIGVVLAIIFRRNIRQKLTPNQDVDNLDKGQLISVKEVAEDGSATVDYRGAKWKAFLKEGTLEPGLYHIEKIDGTRLILSK